MTPAEVTITREGIRPLGSPRVVIVGEAPSRVQGPAFGSGPGARRLAQVLGHELETFLKRYVRVNVCPDVEWSRKKAHDHAIAMHSLCATGTKFILCGRKVHEAFGRTVIRPYLQSEFMRMKLLSYWQDDKCDFILIPHPSGRSRWWNDDKNMLRAQLFLKRWR